MNFEIKLGKGRGGLCIDPAKLVNGRCLIQGTSGSGKSYLIRVIVEQTIQNHLQTIILDPEGEFVTLREKCDVIIAGKEGDVPTETRSAKLLARRIAETGVSTVIDMSDLKLDERREFVKIFLTTLDSLPKKLEAPRLVVLDEAHKFCPESGKGQATSTEAVITLMSQGRKRGLCGILLTQRLSKLKKDAAAEAANVFIGKTSPIDLKSAQDMLGVVKEDREALRSLSPGWFYATGPALSEADVTSFKARKARTTHPEPGKRYQLKAPPPKKVIAKILHEFEILPPSKEQEEAQSLAEAQKEIGRLKKQASSLQSQLDHVTDGVDRVIEKTIQQAHTEMQADFQESLKAALEDRDHRWWIVVQAIKERVEQVFHDERKKGGPTMPDLPQLPTYVMTTKTGRTQSSRPNHSAPPRAVMKPPQKRGPRSEPKRKQPRNAVDDLPFSWNSAPGKLLTVLLQHFPSSLLKKRVAALAGVNYRPDTHNRPRLLRPGFALPALSRSRRAPSLGRVSHRRLARQARGRGASVDLRCPPRSRR